MAILNLWNYVSIVDDGVEYTAKQGAATDVPQTPFQLTVNGTEFSIANALATATAFTVWSAANDQPSTFSYLHFWADQICYLQLITAATNVIHKVAATVPLVLPGYMQILAAANTTPIVGGVQPTVANLASLVLGNYSGTTLNYRLLLVG